ncbi:MAG: PQQ-dependent sugar dehydrogenase [bacterium]|nr:PQQ-dependent sugar dehydrogenase [bacterium]
MFDSLARRALILALLATAPAMAQMPDCTGISDVSDFDGPTVGTMDGVLTTVRVASGLLRPLFVASPPGDTERLFIVEQDGTIRILQNGVLLGTPFLDISSQVQSPADGWANEEGLLGFAFHPDYASNGHVYVYYTGNGGTNYSNFVDRITVSAGDPNVANPASQKAIIKFEHPTATYHHGGMLAFSPTDGNHLYVGTGDGALSPCDPSGNGQSLNTKYGKLLRLNLDTFPYVTDGNPFDGPTPGQDEIWAYGIRNPHRFSFDRENGTLYIGDVGQFDWEEVNCQPATSTGGENYGWDLYEGDFCPNPSCGSQGSCGPTDYVPPIAQYSLAGLNCTIIGGYVYRGCRMSDLRGTYFYADHCSDIIETFRTDSTCSVAEPLSRAADLAPGGGLSIVDITSFGEDARGELYIVDRGGEVFKIEPTLAILEVSAPGAARFDLDDVVAGDWSWEDVTSTSAHPIAAYKIYRSDGDPTGPFDCLLETAGTNWAGGDPQQPGAGDVFFYLVTARNAAGEESRAGNRSDGNPRVVDTASVCN